MKLRIGELEKKLQYKLPAVDTETKERVLTHLSIIDLILDEPVPNIQEAKELVRKAKELLNRIP